MKESKILYLLLSTGCTPLLNLRFPLPFLAATYVSCTSFPRALHVISGTALDSLCALPGTTAATELVCRETLPSRQSYVGCLDDFYLQHCLSCLQNQQIQCTCILFISNMGNGWIVIKTSQEMLSGLA